VQSSDSMLLQQKLVGLAKRQQRTPQESLVASLLRELGFRFREQVPMVVSREKLIFDFLVGDRVLVECMVCGKTNHIRAWNTLRNRLIYLDYKFRLAKHVGTFTTVALLEATTCPRSAFPYPQTVSNLAATDYVITTLLKLGQLLIDLLSADPIAAQARIAQKDLEKWLNGGTP